MTKLLNKPLKAFAIYSLIILLISIPVYVFVVDYIWISELDENNWLTLQHTKLKLQSKEFTNSEIEQINHIWGELQPGMSIEKAEAKSDFQDSVYQAIRPNSYDLDDGEDRFRGLKSYVEINGQPYLITIETNVEESDETFIAVAIVTFVFFTVLILGFMLLNRSIATKTWKPFYQTLNALKNFELSKAENIDLPKSDIQEFHELNASLEQLIKNNVEAYLKQKSFTENASHELQTPIALLKSRLDILLQEENITPEISEIISSIEAPLSRLSRINKNLLLLAKVENHQFGDLENIDIKESIDFCISLFEDYIESEEITLLNHVQASKQVEANPFLLETLLNNLLSNAIRHNAKGGEIFIHMEHDTLLFSNSGNAALAKENLFERFSSVSKSKVSSGLGLSIVKEIAKQHGWSVAYHFENDLHIFSVKF